MESTTDLVAAVNRQLEAGERDGRPTKVIVARRTFPTDVDDLWDALTDPERLSRWFLPVTGDLRVGGRYELEGNASGEILQCDPPDRLSLTWVYDEQTSWVDVELRSNGSGERTELELRHTAHVPDDFWNEFGPGAVGIGWDLALLGLHHHLIGDPIDSQTFGSSEPGRMFAAESSRAWRDASIDAGTPPDAADAAAERTTAFYTEDPGDVG
jgi:uncharacterized protein YndB with AHSA1/START domain